MMKIVRSKVLVLSPTRELIRTNKRYFELFTDGMAFKSGVVLGGVNQMLRLEY